MIFFETFHNNTEYPQRSLILNERKGQICYWKWIVWKKAHFCELFFVVYFILLFNETAFLILNVWITKNVTTPTSYWASFSIRLYITFQSLSFKHFCPKFCFVYYCPQDLDKENEIQGLNSLIRSYNQWWNQLNQCLLIIIFLAKDNG